MNKLYTAIATLLALTCLTLGTAACTNPQGTAIAISSGSADTVLNTTADEVAYYGLLKGEKALNDAASAAADMDIVQPGSPTAIKIADLLAKYTQVSLAAQQAKRLNDATGIAAKVAEGKALYAEILELTSGKKVVAGT